MTTSHPAGPGSSFDRLRPRTQARPAFGAEPAHDAQGKRVLFSSATEAPTPSVGSALVECSRCEGRTVLGLSQALRAAFPSLHLGLRVGHGTEVHAVGVLKHDYPTYMRCPACGRPSWVRFTLQI